MTQFDEIPPKLPFHHQVPIRAEDVPAQAQEEDGRQEDQEDAAQARRAARRGVDELLVIRQDYLFVSASGLPRRRLT